MGVEARVEGPGAQRLEVLVAGRRMEDDIVEPGPRRGVEPDARAEAFDARPRDRAIGGEAQLDLLRQVEGDVRARQEILIAALGAVGQQLAVRIGGDAKIGSATCRARVCEYA